MGKFIKAATMALVSILVLSGCSAAESSNMDDAKSVWPKVGDCMSGTPDVILSRTDAGSVPCQDGVSKGLTLGVFDVPATATFDLEALYALDFTTNSELSAEELTQVESFIDFQANADLECRALLNEQLGGLGSYRMTLNWTQVSLPSSDKWKSGERWLRCSVYAIDKSGETFSFKALPADFKKSPANISKQLCILFEPKTIAGSCTLADFDDGAWLQLFRGIPFRQLGEFPGTAAKVKSQILDKCIEYSRGSINQQLNSDDYYWNWDSQLSFYVNLSFEEFNPELWRSNWQNPGLTFNCHIPNWAYSSSP